MYSYVSLHWLRSITFFTPAGLELTRLDSKIFRVYSSRVRVSIRLESIESSPSLHQTRIDRVESAQVRVESKPDSNRKLRFEFESSPDSTRIDSFGTLLSADINE